MKRSIALIVLSANIDVVQPTPTCPCPPGLGGIFTSVQANDLSPTDSQTLMQENVKESIVARDSLWRCLPQMMCDATAEYANGAKATATAKEKYAKASTATGNDCASTENHHRFDHTQLDMDIKYHRCYEPNRVLVQKAIVQWFTTDIVKFNAATNIKHDHPWIIFTGGAMGVGKGFVIGLLAESMLPILSSKYSLIANPDLIRPLLPEYTPKQDVMLYQDEAGLLNELIIEEALAMGHNIIIDGSLRSDWNANTYLPALKAKHPNCRFAVVGVLPENEEGLRANVENRNQASDRQTDVQLSIDSWKDSTKTMKMMEDAVDIVVYVTNPGVAHKDKPMIIKMLSRGQSVGVNEAMTADQIKTHKSVILDDTYIETKTSAKTKKTRKSKKKKSGNKPAFNHENSSMIVGLDPIVFISTCIFSIVAVVVAFFMFHR